MKTLLIATEKFGPNLGPDDRKGCAIAVMFALIFAATLATGYLAYMAFRGPPEPYSTIYVLNSDRTLDLPETVIIGQNNTFDVWAAAENHMGATFLFEIRLKIVEEADLSFPVNAEPKSVYSMTIPNGERVENLVNISIESSGRYMLVFELWRYDERAVAQFTGNACVLKIEAISKP